MTSPHIFPTAVKNRLLTLSCELLTDLLDTMEQTSLSALGGGVPLPIKNAIQHFEEELKKFFVPA